MREERETRSEGNIDIKWRKERNIIEIERRSERRERERRNEGNIEIERRSERRERKEK